MPSSCSLQSTVIPWIVPRVDVRLESWILANGEKRNYKARDVLLNETQPYDRVYFVASGVVAQGVVDASIYTKPLAINLFTAGRLMGLLNVFTSVYSPRKLIALSDVEVYTCSHRTLHEKFLNNLEQTLLLASYCELSAKSELVGMEVLFSMDPKKRLEMLFSVLLVSDGAIDINGSISPDAESFLMGESFVKLPYTLPREAMRSVMYLSKSAFDRLLGDWSRTKGFVRDENGNIWVDVRRLADALKWIRQH